MDDLIEAMGIFKRYANIEEVEYPTQCNDGCMYVVIKNSIVSGEDKYRLLQLGFEVCDFTGFFVSYKFGSSPVEQEDY